MTNRFQTGLKNNKKLLFFVKLVITAAICTIILWSVDWQSIFQTIQGSNTLLIAVVFVLMVLSVTLSAYKWKLILSIHDIHFSFHALHQWYFVAMFLNNLLPSTIGGDGYRVFKTLDNPRSKSCAVIAILVERITGLLALLFLGYIGGIVSFTQRQDEFSRFIVVAGTVCLAIFIPLFYLAIQFKILRRLLQSKRCPQKLRTLSEHIADYGKRPLKTISVLLISFLFQMHSLFFNWLLIVALGKMLSIFGLAVAVTLTNIIAVLPISINGLGLTEGSFMYFTGFYGLDHETSLLAALILRVLLIPIGLIGGLIYLRGNDRNATTTSN